MIISVVLVAWVYKPEPPEEEEEFPKAGRSRQSDVIQGACG
jgi:hypothetical protein